MPEDIELNVNNDTLTISGEKGFSNEVKRVAMADESDVSKRGPVRPSLEELMAESSAHQPRPGVVEGQPRPARLFLTTQ